VADDAGRSPARVRRGMVASHPHFGTTGAYFTLKPVMRPDFSPQCLLSSPNLPRLAS
jgi:hypothetical protein